MVDSTNGDVAVGNITLFKPSAAMAELLNVLPAGGSNMNVSYAEVGSVYRDAMAVSALPAIYAELLFSAYDESDAGDELVDITKVVHIIHAKKYLCLSDRVPGKSSAANNK